MQAILATIPVAYQSFSWATPIKIYFYNKSKSEQRYKLVLCLLSEINPILSCL